MNRLFLIVLFLAPLAALAAAPQTPAAGPIVSGRVIRSAAAPAAPSDLVFLTEMGSSTPTVSESRIGADGSFQFTKVRPGTYRLQVPSTSADRISDPVTVVVNDRDVTGIEITVRAMVEVAWSVVVEGGGLVPSMTVSLVQYRGGQAARSISLNEAVSSRTVPEGQYRVSWSALPAGYNLKSMTAGANDVLATPLKIEGGGMPTRIVITLGVASPPPWVKVSGRVLSLPAGPLPAGLRLILEEASTLRRTPEAAPAADGSFEFPMVLPGTYRPVLAGAPSVQVLSPASLVVPTRDLTGAQIAIAARKQLTGKVIVEGASPKEMPDVMMVATNHGQSTVLVQSDGSFSVTLPVGNATILVVAPGYDVRALTYGGSNLLREQLKIGLTDTAELRVTVSPVDSK